MSLEAQIEALLFASDRPLSADELCRLMTVADERDGVVPDKAAVTEALRLIGDEFTRRGGGFTLVHVAGGFEFRTRPGFAELVSRLFDRRPSKLSQPALETMAIIAYRQPVTRALVDELRGVDSSAPMRTLLERELITLSGRSQEPGRPHLYRTTKQFLRTFGLVSLGDLPNMREVKELTQGHLFKESDLDAPSDEDENSE